MVRTCVERITQIVSMLRSVSLLQILCALICVYVCVCACCVEKRKEEIKKQLLAVSLASNVLSCETAYVGVNKETRHALPIPTQVPPTVCREISF